MASNMCALRDGMSDTEVLDWRKSSWSIHNGNCIEIAPLVTGHRAVRDSMNKSGEILLFTNAEWVGFISKIKGDISSTV
jgi:hypothetical protein